MLRKTRDINARAIKNIMWELPVDSKRNRWTEEENKKYVHIKPYNQNHVRNVYQKKKWKATDSRQSKVNYWRRTHSLAKCIGSNSKDKLLTEVVNLSGLYHLPQRNQERWTRTSNQISAKASRVNMWDEPKKHQDNHLTDDGERGLNAKKSTHQRCVWSRNKCKLPLGKSHVGSQMLAL